MEEITLCNENVPPFTSKVKSLGTSRKILSVTANYSVKILKKHLQSSSNASIQLSRLFIDNRSEELSDCNDAKRT